MDAKKEILNLLNELSDLNNDGNEITFDTNLLEIGIDSITFIKLIVEIENKFGIEYPDDELAITDLITISSINNVINNHSFCC